MAVEGRKRGHNETELLPTFKKRNEPSQDGGTCKMRMNNF